MLTLRILVDVKIMSWRGQEAHQQGINGDRRFDRRYGISLEVRWKLVRRRKVLETGVGWTVDLSSGGVLFDAGRPLPVGLNVELSISWPALLHDVAPMQLVVAGRIVRAHGSRTAIHMTQHEFRTAGASQAEGRAVPGSPPARATYFPGAHFAKFGSLQ
jgi:hypothetical protein